MSLRKPKSIIIKHLEDEDDEVNEILPVKDNKKIDKKKNKIKIKTFEDYESNDLKDAEIKIKKKLKSLSIPLFKDEDDDDLEGKPSIHQQFLQQKKKEIIKPKPSKMVVDVNIPDIPGDVIIEPTLEDSKAPEYISLDDSIINKKEIESESDANDSDIEMVDDGILPLTKSEVERQEKLEKMGIKDALYDLEIENEGEDNDWENEKLKHGTYGNVNIMRQRQKISKPKLNLVNEDDSLKKEIEELTKKIKEIKTNNLALEKKTKSNSDISEGITASIEEIGSRLYALRKHKHKNTV